MNIKESLINELKTRITELDKGINREELSKLSELKTIAKSLNDKIETIRKIKNEGKKIDKDIGLTKEDFFSVNTKSILEIFPDFNKNILNELENYINRCFGLFGIVFNQHKDEVLNTLSLICTNLLDKITEKENIVNSINAEKDKLQQLINSLENNYENIFDNDINKIIEFLKQINKTEAEILQYIKELILDIEKYINESKSMQEEAPEETMEEEIIEENEENSETIKQGIIRILNENGYSDIVSYFEEEKGSEKIKKAKEKLYKYGKLDNIEQIVKTLRKYNINLLEEMESNFFKIINIFKASSKENLEKIFNLALESDICICKYDELGNLILDEKGNPQINFTLLLERESRFISRRIKYKKRGSNTQNIDIDSEIVGNMSDYIKNIRYFQNVLGVDFKKIFYSPISSKNKKELEESEERKNSRNKSYVYLDVPHAKVLRNQNAFNLYQIPLKSCASALSCFTATNPEDTIDMFIELDAFDFLKNKMSNVTKKFDNPMFFAIARTYQLADKLPNPQNLTLHENARRFLYSQWKKNETPAATKRYIYAPEKVDFKNPETIQVGNPNALSEKIIHIQLNTGVTKTNGDKVTKKYRREEVLTESQMYNFKCFDEVIVASDNISFDLIDPTNLLIRRISQWAEKSNVIILGTEPNEFRISKLKFFRIYNTLCKNKFNLENDRDCVLYALTYNSILTKEQFELVKRIVDNYLLRGIPQTEERVGVRK